MGAGTFYFTKCSQVYRNLKHLKKQTELFHNEPYTRIGVEKCLTGMKCDKVN